MANAPTPRDNFAAAALTGLIIAGNHDTQDSLTGADEAERERTARGLALTAVLIADAMVEATKH